MQKAAGSLVPDGIPALCLLHRDEIGRACGDAPSTPAGNPNNNALCGRKINASYGGKTITVTVADRCEGCPGLDDLDLSPSAFHNFADMGIGRIQGTWEWA